jgi:hypothetical protein
VAHHVQEIECACSDCKSTGLYVGMAEARGAAVVCNSCEGTGKKIKKIEWDDFKGRKELPNIKRVYATNPGIMIGEDKTRDIHLEDFGGMPYSDWLSGRPWAPGLEDRKHTCPAWWYQSFNYKLKPTFPDCRGVVAFSDCHSFATKNICWGRWDKEYAPKFSV